jgi:hypothetical protein
MYGTTGSQEPASKRGWYLYTTFPLGKDIMLRGPLKIHQQGKFNITLSFTIQNINQLFISTENGLFFAGNAVREPARITWLDIVPKLMIHTLCTSGKRTRPQSIHTDRTGRRI